MTFSKQNGTTSISHLLFFLSNNSSKTASRETFHLQWNLQGKFLLAKIFQPTFGIEKILGNIYFTDRSFFVQDHLDGEYQEIKPTHTSLRTKVSVTNKSMSQQHINGKWKRRDLKALIMRLYEDSGCADVWKLLSGNNNSLSFGLDRWGNMESCISFQSWHFTCMGNVKFSVPVRNEAVGERKSKA